MPQVSVWTFVVLYGIYSVIFSVVAKRNGADMKEVRVLIPLTFGFLVLPAIYLVWRGWFKSG